MFDFNAFLDALKDGLLALGSDEAKEIGEALLKDGEDFARAAKNDLEGWAKQVLDGTMSPGGLEFAIRGRTDALEVVALGQIGEGKIRLDELRNKILDTVVSAATKTIVP